MIRIQFANSCQQHSFGGWSAAVSELIDRASATGGLEARRLTVMQITYVGENAR
jgi:hypothetical protein